MAGFNNQLAKFLKIEQLTLTSQHGLTPANWSQKSVDTHDFLSSHS